jgi:uncharacterized protein YdhG (YjbR/CyaY superfamily)
MARSNFASVDDYLAAQPAPARAALQRLRATILKALPNASESISYQIPAYKIDGAMVIYFAGFRDHYSIYPATAGVVSTFGKELGGALHGKATIRFRYSDALPARLVTRIAKLRAAEAAERVQARASRKASPPKPKSKAKPKVKSTPSRKASSATVATRKKQRLRR